MKVAGIDFSSDSVDVVVLDLDSNRADWLHYNIGLGCPGGRGIDRARYVRDVMPVRTSWADEGVIKFAIEKPFSRAMPSVSALMRIQGAILACLPSEVQVVELAPATWKAMALGKGHGHASKFEVARFARERWDGALHMTQDAADAFAIAWAARQEFDPDQKTIAA